MQKLQKIEAYVWKDANVEMGQVSNNYIMKKSLAITLKRYGVKSNSGFNLHKLTYCKVKYLQSDQSMIGDCSEYIQIALRLRNYGK